MTNKSGTLYIGVINDLIRRIYDHKQGKGTQCAARCRIARLLHFEGTPNVQAAITREKQLKGWTQAKKLELIMSNTSQWNDLSTDWENA